MLYVRIHLGAFRKYGGPAPLYTLPRRMQYSQGGDPWLVSPQLLAVKVKRAVSSRQELGLKHAPICPCSLP
jgi:hypothetical protein